MIDFNTSIQESEQEIRVFGGQEYVRVQGVWKLKSSIKEPTIRQKMQRELLDTLTLIEQKLSKVITLIPIGHPEAPPQIEKLKTMQNQIHNMHLSIGGMYRGKE